jgi:hypothetical protein
LAVSFKHGVIKADSMGNPPPADNDSYDFRIDSLSIRFEEVPKKGTDSKASTTSI